MAKIIDKKRLNGGYKYVKCECDKEIEIDKPMTLKLPYCSECNKIVFDANQNYCCWCGSYFTE